MSSDKNPTKDGHKTSPPNSLFYLRRRHHNNNNNRTRTPPSIPSTMPRTPRDHFRRRYDPLRTEAAFDDAFGEADQDNLGREDEELNPSDNASLFQLPP
jgi:hypothetical protein